MGHRAYISITIDESNNLGVFRWLKPVQGKEYRYGILKAGQAILDTKVERLLINSLRLGALTLQDQAWVADKIKDIVARSHIKRVARVSSPDFFQNMALDKVYQTFTTPDSPYEIAVFMTEEEAMEWLLSDTPASDLPG